MFDKMVFDTSLPTSNTTMILSKYSYLLIDETLKILTVLHIILRTYQRVSQFNSKQSLNDGQTFQLS